MKDDKIICEKISRLHESFKEREIILLRAKLWCLHRIQDIAWERENRMRNFSQKLYTFLLKLKLYLSDRALSHADSQHDHVINLDHTSWSQDHVIINLDQLDFSHQYWFSWSLSSILIANLDIEIHDECSTKSSYLLMRSVLLHYYYFLLSFFM